MKIWTLYIFHYSRINAYVHYHKQYDLILPNFITIKIRISQKNNTPFFSRFWRKHLEDISRNHIAIPLCSIQNAKIVDDTHKTNSMLPWCPFSTICKVSMYTHDNSLKHSNTSQKWQHVQALDTKTVFPCPYV